MRKNSERKKINITFIYKDNGIKLEEILREGYMCYIRNLKN